MLRSHNNKKSSKDLRSSIERSSVNRDLDRSNSNSLRTSGSTEHLSSPASSFQHMPRVRSRESNSRDSASNTKSNNRRSASNATLLPEESTLPKYDEISILQQRHSNNTILLSRFEIPASHHSWDSQIKSRKLRVTPPNYKLQKSHTEITGKELPNTLRTIKEVLRSLNIFGVLDKQEHKIVAKTAENVRFHVKMWKKERSPGTVGKTNTSNAPVIVEICRMSGTSIAFFKQCRCILNAIKGKPYSCNQSPSLLSNSNSGKQFQVRNFPHLECPIQQIKDCVESLECFEKMIYSEYTDVREKGVEGLMHLTDKNSSFKNASVYAARATLGEVEAFKELSQVLTSAILNSSDSSSSIDDDYKCCQSYPTGLELGVFANALSVLSEEGELPSMIEKQPSYFTDTLIESFLEMLKTSLQKFQINDAYLSTKSLNLLCRLSSDARSKAVELDAPQIFILSKKVGQCSHSLLEIESKKAMEALDLDARSQQNIPI